jgi:hypothetical protein
LSLKVFQVSNLPFVNLLTEKLTLMWTIVIATAYLRNNQRQKYSSHALGHSRSQGLVISKTCGDNEEHVTVC